MPKRGIIMKKQLKKFHVMILNNNLDLHYYTSNVIH